MNIRKIIVEVLYYIGISLILMAGILLKSISLSVIAIYSLYSTRYSNSLKVDKAEISVDAQKYNFLWNLIFLGLSSVLFFSLIKVIFNIILKQFVPVQSQWILPVSVSGVLYFEILYRFSVQKKNRITAVFLLIILVVSAGALILGGLWFKTDLIIGFISLLIIVIISFRRAYLELTNILERNRDNNAN
jgi:hypothetical protein